MKNILLWLIVIAIVALGAWALFIRGRVVENTIKPTAKTPPAKTFVPINTPPTIREFAVKASNFRFDVAELIVE